MSYLKLFQTSYKGQLQEGLLIVTAQLRVNNAGMLTISVDIQMTSFAINIQQKGKGHRPPNKC